MKKILSVSILVLTTFSNFLFAQNSGSPIDPKWEKNYQNNYEYNFYNNDYCDYYVVHNVNITHELRPGKNTLMQMTEANSTYNRTTFPSTYRYYKGKFVEKFNPDFLYNLPVRNGDSTKVGINTKEKELTYLFSVRAADTVYACREGIVCLYDAQDMSSKFYNRIPDKNSILIYHNDFTFAEYRNLSEAFVAPGEQVKVGQPIGKAKNSKIEDKLKSISVAFFFLDKNKFASENTGSKHSNFAPVFHTANAGNTKLDEKKSYISQLNDSLITQEMSKKEKKRYEKKKLKALEKK